MFENAIQSLQINIENPLDITLQQLEEFYKRELNKVNRKIEISSDNTEEISVCFEKLMELKAAFHYLKSGKWYPKLKEDSLGKLFPVGRKEGKLNVFKVFRFDTLSNNLEGYDYGKNEPRKLAKLHASLLEIYQPTLEDPLLIIAVKRAATECIEESFAILKDRQKREEYIRLFAPSPEEVDRAINREIKSYVLYLRNEATSQIISRKVAIVNHYKVLGITPSSSYKAIQRSYRELMRKTQSRVMTNLNESFINKAYAQAANAAFEILKDPVQRAEYDLVHKRLFPNNQENPILNPKQISTTSSAFPNSNNFFTPLSFSIHEVYSPTRQINLAGSTLFQLQAPQYSKSTSELSHTYAAQIKKAVAFLNSKQRQLSLFMWIYGQPNYESGQAKLIEIASAWEKDLGINLTTHTIRSYFNDLLLRKLIFYPYEYGKPYRDNEVKLTAKGKELFKYFQASNAAASFSPDETRNLNNRLENYERELVLWIYDEEAKGNKLSYKDLYHCMDSIDEKYGLDRKAPSTRRRYVSSLGLLNLIVKDKSTNFLSVKPVVLTNKGRALYNYLKNNSTDNELQGVTSIRATL